ncbi:hypothetical protein F5Y06DRAFT_259489 [Hypoxylon sp. FL0890]|nr:hypothetical protein F5Y06DRAFT_259489 [Hypoxylon sp. FL0890]
MALHFDSTVFGTPQPPSNDGGDLVRGRSVSPLVSSRPSVESLSTLHSQSATSPLTTSIRPQNASRSSLSSNTLQRNSTNRPIDSGHQNGRSENSRANMQPKHPALKTNEPISWWWWWEILAIILSLACMCGLVVLLAKIDNLPLQSWWLPIEPNSLVAALITVAKASMMVAVASCIGQLKWRHFTIRPRTLADLQLFDNASRGPWGSALLLWSLSFRVRVLVTFGFALITIVALGMDTSAQQVLTFPLRESPLNNASIVLGVANMYNSKGFLADTTYGSNIWVPNSDLFALEAAIINGAIGPASKPYFTCPEPANRCEWDSFTTLGVCPTFADVTDVAVPTCSPEDNEGNLNCTYSFPGILDFDNSSALVMSYNQENLGGAGPTTMVFQSQFTQSNSAFSARLGSFMAVNVSSNVYPTMTHSGLVPPPVQVYSGTFSWCAQTFRNVTGTQTDVNATSRLSESLTFNSASRSDDGYTDSGQINNTMGAHYYSYVSNSTGLLYNVSEMAVFTLPSYLHTLLSATVKHNIYRDDVGPENQLLEMGFALQHLDLENVITGIAETLTNQIRSSNPGDNYNASTITGKAYFKETYIHVRWGWMSLPLAEVVLTAFLLGLSIAITRKQPLLKDSVTALLISRLYGWSDDELDVSGALTQEKLDDLAEKITTKLEVGDVGRLKFVKG